MKAKKFKIRLQSLNRTLDQFEHLLNATYAWPAENIWLSRDKDTSGKVNPCVLCTVRANAFCKGNWHLLDGFHQLKMLQFPF